jgi:hypothetical protein
MLTTAGETRSTTSTTGVRRMASPRAAWAAAGSDATPEARAEKERKKTTDRLEGRRLAATVGGIIGRR